LRDQDGEVKAYLAKPAREVLADPFCRDASSISFQLNAPPNLQSMIEEIDLAADFMGELFKYKDITCEGGANLTNAVSIEVPSLRLSGGEFAEPAIGLVIDTDVDKADFKVKCATAFESPTIRIVVGAVPVWFKFTFDFGIEIASTGASHIRAVLRPGASTFSGSSEGVKVSAQVGIGVVMYSVLGGALGANFNFTPAPPPDGCYPGVDLELEYKASASAGYGPFTVTAEKTWPQGKQPLIAPYCPQTPQEAPAECRCDGFDWQNEPVQRSCGEAVCAGDGMMWQCTTEGFVGTADPCN